MCADNAYELDNLKGIFYLFKENTGEFLKGKRIGHCIKKIYLL